MVDTFEERGGRWFDRRGNGKGADLPTAVSPPKGKIGMVGLWPSYGRQFGFGRRLAWARAVAGGGYHVNMFM